MTQKLTLMLVFSGITAACNVRSDKVQNVAKNWSIR